MGLNFLSPRLNILLVDPVFGQEVLAGKQLPMPELAEPLLLQQVLNTQTMGTFPKFAQSLVFLHSLLQLSEA
jgi:hypothetical protein